MKNMASVIGDVAHALVTLFKGLVVVAIFAGVAFNTVPGDFAGYGGLSSFISAFLDGGLVGLLTLLVLASWMK